MFRAVGTERRFKPRSDFWSDGADGLLFQFTLHEFLGFANDPFWQEIAEDWLQQCGLPRYPAWHPYPTSGRILNWCRALSTEGWPPALAARLKRSLWLQARFLGRSVEHDVGGNHVIKNGVALATAGICFDAEPLRGRGLRLLQRELGRQLLADGGHEELSPSYHRAIRDALDDLSTLLHRAGQEERWLDAAVERMDEWLASVACPDGTLPLIGDSWVGPPVAASSARVRVLPETGWISLRHGEDWALLLCGSIGPVHLPAHVHAHALSFVFWHQGRPVVVDPGSGTYSGAKRDLMRSTQVHSTVAVDGQDQCQFLGPFRAAHLPKVRLLQIEVSDDAVLVIAEHDGFAPVTHRRAFYWLPGDGLVVVDRLDRTASVTTTLPLGPGATDVAIRGFGPGGPPVREDILVAPFLGTWTDAEALRRSGVVPGGQLFGWSLLESGGLAEVIGETVRIERPGRPDVVLDLS